MLKKQRDFAFFVDPFKFELYEKSKRIDAINLSFVLPVHLFVLALRSLLHNLTLQM